MTSRSPVHVVGRGVRWLRELSCLETILPRLGYYY
jgi:hypothetical protein